MGRTDDRRCNNSEKALEHYSLGDFAKCEQVLQSCPEGCNLCFEYLARLYYELGSPYKAASVLRKKGLERLAELYIGMCEEGDLVVKSGKEKTVTKDIRMKSYVKENEYVVPLDSSLINEIVEEYRGLFPEKVLKEIEEIAYYGKRTSRQRGHKD